MPSAPLIPLNLIGPGFYGLNTQASSQVLGPEWAGEALNMVFDDVGRPSSRKGWTTVTTTPISGTPDIIQLFEYYKLDGTKYVISAANNKLYSGTTSFTDLTGAVTVTADNWKFVNFYGAVYGIQTSHALISYNGTGTFANVTAGSGSVPDGNCLLSAFGRLWGSSADGQTLKYCGLLDGTNWGGSGAGSINFSIVWTDGSDTIQGLASFSNYIIVFGKKHIILLEDGSGSELGLNPQYLRVKEVVGGVGLLGRDTVQSVDGNDLLFMSYSGLQSLRRVIQGQGNPLLDVSRNVRDALVRDALVSPAFMRTTYVAREGFYLIKAGEQIYCFDTRIPLDDGTLRFTKLDNFIPRSFICLDDNMTLYGGKAGEVFQYSNYLDDGTTYRFAYASGWLKISDEVESRLKFLKRIGSLVEVSGDTTLFYKWAFDFKDFTKEIARTTSFQGGGAEWNVSEWNVGEFGGSSGFNEFEIPASGSGQYIKVGVESIINSVEVSLQQLQLFTKIGRLT